MSLPRHSAALSGLGLVACLSGHALLGSVPAVGTNQWAAGPALIEARAGATATSLGDGDVLVVGGRGASGPLASVELLTSSGAAVPVAPMSLARAEHTAALVGDSGNVLVAGGATVVSTEEGTAEVVTGSVEVFDAAAAAWYPVGSLTHPRAGATAVALSEGRIAIVGGHDASGPVLEIEIYDPAAGAFGVGGATSAPRANAAITATRDGHIVVVGGLVDGVAQATADIIDPVGGTVATVALTSPRTGASATTTVEDQVLIAGGFDGTTTLATTEVLDPVTGNSASGASLGAARTDHRAYLLPHNGGVLLVGGSNAGGLVEASELVIPWMGAAQALGLVTVPRSQTTGAAGPHDGVFVVAGGSTAAAGAASASSDYFGFATVKTDKDDYAPGEFVTITGSGWQPGETVNLVLREVGTGAADTPLNAVVEADGTFANDFWAPSETHLGVRFYLTAIGAAASAQHTFTDSRTINAATLDGVSSVTVLPGASILAQVFVTTDNGGGNNDWEGTRWRISTTPMLVPADGTCVDTNDFADSGIGLSNSFNVTAPLAAGTYNAYFAAYQNDTCANGQSNVFSLASGVVVKANTTTTITTDTPDPSTVGQSVTISYSVAVVAPGTGTPTGNVTVSDGSQSCTGTVAAGQCSISFSTTGTRTLTATYAGATHFNGSTSAGESHQVNQHTTVTTITNDSPDPTVVGQPYAVTWTVLPVPAASGTPTGTVTVVDGTGGTCSAAVSAGTCSLASTSPGLKTLVATYGGDATFSTSTSAGVGHQVNKADTTTLITSDTPDPTVVGQSYAVNWAVTVTAPGTGTPTGNVSVADGTGGSCVAAASAGTCDLTSTSAGAKTLSATYAGDTNFNGSADTDTHTVNKADTATTITSDAPDPTVVGQQYTVQWTFAVVAPGAGTPTGNVTVDDGSGGSCVAAASAATCNLTSTSAGVKTLTATYAGDTNFNGSADTDTHTVNKADTATTITSDAPDPTVVGQQYTVQWTFAVVAPGAGTPTGNVTVVDGTGGSCVAAASAGTCNLTSASAGAKTLTATYAGDTNFNGSADTDTHQVNKAATTLEIISDTPDPSVVGQSYTVQWTFAVVAPGAGTPSGNIVVSDGAVSCNALAAVGTGSCSLASTSAGAKTLTATFTEDAGFLGSSDTDTHQVDKASTTTLITSVLPDPSVVGQSYTVNWTVAVTAPGSGTPTGLVSVDDGTGGTCSAAAGLGTCNLTSTSAGAKTLTATYAGDTNFNGSADTEGHQVDKASTTTVIVSDAPDPSVSGQLVTITFGVSVNAPGAGTPTGLVTVSDGTLNCSASVAVGQCDITFPTAGIRTLTATYAGDSNFNGSVSAGTSHLVNKADTAAAIIADLPDPSLVGQPVVITFGVTVSTPGAGVPTGNVTVSDGVQNWTGTVLAGQCTIALVTPGARTLVATYAGDANFNGSVSPGAAHNVNFQFFGFFTPIDNQPIVNNAKAGQAIPTKWRLLDAAGNAISSPSSFVSLDSFVVPCGAWDTLPADIVPEVAAGGSGLQYLGDGHWQFNWKTPKQYANQCRLARVSLSDGSVHDFNVKFKP